MRKLFLPATLAFLVGCSQHRENQNDISGQLDAYFAPLFDDRQPGMAIHVVVKDSVIFSRGYGVANMATMERITPETLFNVGSLTKTFVANAILQLQEKGLMSIEDSLTTFFPQFKHRYIADQIKIKHLLTHTSGLPDNRKVSDDSVFYLTAKDSANWYPEMQVDSLRFPPGSQFEYSNPAFNGLALVIEQITNMPWQQYVISEIIRPSNMHISTITDGPHPKSGVSHAYEMNQGSWVEDDYGEEPTFPAAGNGGVWSSVKELASYEEAIRNAVFLPGQVVQDSRTVQQFGNWQGTIAPEADWSWFRTKSTAQITGGQVHYRPFVGWSWFIDKLPDGAQLVGHTGTQGGFRCNYVSIPEKDIFFVILTNSPRDTHAYSEEVMRALGLY
jgi:CubicO group peptidase (beta-lactamase class C family)